MWLLLFTERKDAMEKNCLLCGGQINVESVEDALEKIIECKKCRLKIRFSSRYSVEKLFNGDDERSLKFRACYYYYFTQKRGANELYYIADTEDTKEIEAFRKRLKDHTVITVKQLLDLYPRNISERIDMILENLTYLNKYVGGKIYLKYLEDSEKKKLILFITNSSQYNANQEEESILKMLQNLGLITQGRERDLSDYVLTLNYRAWQRLDEISKEGAKHGQGFIAMWFDETMPEIKNAITEAIRGAGYKAIIMSDYQHNKQIVPEILYQIRMSDFVVADLTGNRGGVYFEAGYALGREKEVIFTADEKSYKDKGQEPHFDVRQYNQVRYSTPEELQKSLKERIIATVGKGNFSDQTK